jgi:FlaA1/EpsC-like NDP-sugar epimerase
VGVPRPRWLTTYTAALVVLDGSAMAAATLTAKISWLGINPESLHVRSFSIPYGALALATVPTWLVLLALAGAYDLGPFGSSSGAWTHVVRAGAQLLAVVAVAYYILHLATLGRGVLAGTIPLAVILTLGERAVARVGLDEVRRRGHARRTALVIGTRRGIDAFARQLDADPSAGVTVVAVAVVGETDQVAVPVGHTTLVVTDALAATEAETLIVTGGLAPGQLREIAWTLEGTGVELLVIPTPSDIEGLRSEIRPVAGLPLLYLDS